MTETPKEKPPRKPDLKVLKSELDNPPEAAAPVEREARDVTPADGSDVATTKPNLSYDLSQRDHGEIFPDCPVQALGVHGKTFFYLDWLGQLQDETNHTKDRMRAVFGGRSDILQRWFPQVNKGGVVSGWAQESVATAMMMACAEKGVWNAFEKVRGLGAWPDDEGGVILHCGDAILHKGKWKLPGEIDGYVYPSAVRIPRPLEEQIEPDDTGPGAETLATLSTWRWQRPDIDPYLCLGWICNAIFGGALDWRALMWITGDTGTGKSTLQKLLRHLLGGEGAILQSTDATEASVRQFLMQSTIPVALDEVEAEADNRKVLSVIKLARQAASGGVILRGGSDHKGQEFKARSAFMFSSILVPSLLDQDISRMALLELLPLHKGDTPPAIDQKRWRKIGRGLRTRIVDGWGRLHDTRESYRQALSAAGHSARGCDQFGTLLVMADLALYDELDVDRCANWAEKLSVDVVEEQTDQVTDWQRCLNYLFGQQIDLYRSGERLSVGRWILVAAGMDDSEEISRAQKALSSVGLRVHGRKEGAQLIVANAHPGLAALFEGSHWYAPAAQRGVWAQAMKRVPGSKPTAPTRFDLVGSRAHRFPLRAVPALLDEEATSETPEASETPHNPPLSNDIQDFE